MKGKHLVLLFALQAFPVGVFATGAWFSDSFVMDGDAHFASMLDARFETEIPKMLGEKPDADLETTGPRPSSWELTLKADVNDLADALNAKGTSGTSEILNEYRAMRTAMHDFANPPPNLLDKTPVSERDGDGFYARRLRADASPRPGFNLASYELLLARIPAEFALYVRGAAAYDADDYTSAIEHWKAVLALPASDRSYRGAWASYMIGKVMLITDQGDPVEWFEKTRALVREGSRDSIGVTTESVGWQARAEKDAKEFQQALHHYWEWGKAGGDQDNVISSIRFTCRDAVKLEAIAPGLVKDPLTRKLITTWVLCHGVCDGHDETESSSPLTIWSKWASAVERSGVKLDPEECDRMAWAAYELGRMDEAERWISRTKEHSPVGTWLMAKLALWNGKIDEGVKLLASAVPLIPDEEWSRPSEQWEDTGIASRAKARALGELGMLRLGRREYVAALDAFMTADKYWQDAAFIAERVLTIPELTEYVRTHPVSAKENPDHDYAFCEPDSYPSALKDLLARRLVRAGKLEEARSYVKPELLPTLDDYIKHMQIAKSKSAGARERATSLYTAAMITRKYGMELMGTELDPDWTMTDGEFEREPASERRRLSNPDPQERNALSPPASIRKSIGPTSDEERRTQASAPEIAQRFHYRYKASELMWECAKLLPDNDPMTCAALYYGGIWHKNRDEKYADRFYKALIRRCRNTEFGKEADKPTWFPPNPPPDEPKVTFAEPKSDKATNSE